MSSKNKMQRQKTLLGILTLSLFLAMLFVQIPKTRAASDFLQASHLPGEMLSYYLLGGVYLANDTNKGAYGETFNVDTSGYVTELRVSLLKVGSPVGYIGAFIFSQLGFNDYPYNGTSTLLETSSTAYALADISAVLTEYTFDFSQTVQLEAGNFYSFAVYIINATNIDTSNRINIANKGTTFDGYNTVYDNSISSWNCGSAASNDVTFAIYANVDAYEEESEPEDYWWTEETLGTVVNLFIIIAIVLIPAAILGKLFKLGTFGYATGTVIGAALGYVFFPAIIPIWLVFAVLIGIIGLMLFGRKSK